MGFDLSWFFHLYEVNPSRTRDVQAQVFALGLCAMATAGLAFLLDRDFHSFAGQHRVGEPFLVQETRRRVPDRDDGDGSPRAIKLELHRITFCEGKSLVGWWVELIR
jgi:hypothetical protein